ncbi:hypothetical protein BC943DRAFT_136771 [Umbelopsis sp. AD052]|nr:hypothetical protein BC943DRAFT_136771 [Umbelopsis sp. AD052]
MQEEVYKRRGVGTHGGHKSVRFRLVLNEFPHLNLIYTQSVLPLPEDAFARGKACLIMLLVSTFGIHLSETKDWGWFHYQSNSRNICLVNVCAIMKIIKKNGGFQKILKSPGCCHFTQYLANCKMDSFSRTLQTDSHGKASTIKLFSFARPHMRALHLGWISFMTAFLAWYSIPPLISIIQADLGLSATDVYDSNVVAVAATIAARLFVGPLCERFGPRKVPHLCHANFGQPKCSPPMWLAQLML